MAETPIFCKIHPQQSSRANIVPKMMEIYAKVDCVTRNCLSLAITIFDKFDQMCQQDVPSNFSLTQYHWFMALACLGLAYKFQERKRFNYHTLLDVVPQGFQNDESIAKILKLETVVFQGMKWNIPQKTAYDQLEETISEIDESCKKSYQKILGCLKILMTAYTLGPQVSLNPELGAEIFQLAQKRRNRTSKVYELYKKCTHYLRKQEKENQG